MGRHTQIGYQGHDPSLVTYPSGYSEQFHWDPMRNMTSRTDRANNYTIFRIDHQNRLFQKYDFTHGLITNYTYDAGGRLTQVVDPTGTYTFTYDNMNRLTQTGTNYAFDSAGNLTVGYGYDAGGWPTLNFYSTHNRGCPILALFARVGKVIP